MISKVELEVKSFSYHSYFSGHFNKTVKEINHEQDFYGYNQILSFPKILM